MPDCLPPSALPSVLQDAAQRLPRKSPRQSGTRHASRQRSVTPQNHANNYLAEAPAMRGEGQTSPLGGRNRKGAGAPLRNRNARGARSLRLHIALKNRLRADHLQLLVLAAAVRHIERRVAPQSPARTLQGHHKNLQNNYLAEASAMRRTLHADEPRDTRAVKKGGERLKSARPAPYPAVWETVAAIGGAGT